MSDKPHTLFHEERVQDAVSGLAALIAERYQGQELCVIGLLGSSGPFLADLTRAVERLNKQNLPERCVQMFIGDLALDKEQGSQPVRRDINVDIKGKPVLIVDTVLTTGRTVTEAARFLWQREPTIIEAVVLIKRGKVQRSKRKLPVSRLYFALEVPEDVEVVGYGLDYQRESEKGLGRSLPWIAQVLK